MIRIVARLLAAAAAAMLSVTAHASFHTYVINEIYSNAEGTIQFIELREAQGAAGQNFLYAEFRSVTFGNANSGGINDHKSVDIECCCGECPGEGAGLLRRMRLRDKVFRRVDQFSD